MKTYGPDITTHLQESCGAHVYFNVDQYAVRQGVIMFCLISIYKTLIFSGFLKSPPTCSALLAVYCQLSGNRIEKKEQSFKYNYSH